MHRHMTIPVGSEIMKRHVFILIFAALFSIPPSFGSSIFDYFYKEEESKVPLSTSYLPVAVQVTANLLNQLQYHATSRKPIYSPTVDVEQHGGIFILEYHDTRATEGRNVKKTVKQLTHLLMALNKEATRIHMDTYQGFSDDILKVLTPTSNMSAPLQLRLVLKSVDTSRFRDVTKITLNSTIIQLEDRKSDMRGDLQLLKSLKYLSPSG